MEAVSVNFESFHWTSQNSLTLGLIISNDNLARTALIQLRLRFFTNLFTENPEGSLIISSITLHDVKAKEWVDSTLFFNAYIHSADCRELPA